MFALASGPALAAFQFKVPKVEKKVPQTQEQGFAFDAARYEVWVDNAYAAVKEYGVGERREALPSYGDPMSLEDALKILVPQQWLVRRSKDLDHPESELVSWDIEKGTWVDVLRNLGERHGLRFHVDHVNKNVFVQKGRKLLETRSASESMAETKSDSATDTEGEKSAQKSKPNAGEPVEFAFSLVKGEPVQKLFSEAIELMGYSRFVLVNESARIQETKQYKGSKDAVIGSMAKDTNSKACIYQGNKTVALVAEGLECP